MEKLVWVDNLGLWVTTVSSGALSGQQVFIDTDGADDEPTPLQIRTCETISLLEDTDMPNISELLHAWTAATCDAELLSEYGDDDYQYEINGITVPRIRKAALPHFLIRLRCELDPEHGIGLAFRGGRQFVICHPDSYDNIEWDDADELDAPFKPSR